MHGTIVTTQGKYIGKKRILVQFRPRLSTALDPVFRDHDGEDWDDAHDRRAHNASLPPPTVLFRRTGVKVIGLLDKIRNEKNEKLVLANMFYNVRLKRNSMRYLVATAEFKETRDVSKARRDELDTTGLHVLDEMLNSRNWGEVTASEYQHNPELCSIVFVGETEKPPKPQEIHEEIMDPFGLVLVRAAPKERRPQV
jgi:hypothetical protein